MTISPEQIVAQARTWLNTQWHHGAVCKGVGVDCAGLLIGVSRELGVDVEYRENYSMLDEFELMTSTLEKYCRELEPEEDLQAGDILVFRYRQLLNHCSIFTGEGTMIHAYNSPSVGRVVEEPFDEGWNVRVAKRYRYLNVSDDCEQKQTF